MVKGTAKQAVILRPDKKSGFEQAIFILSPDREGERLESPEDLLRLADSIAGQYTVATLPALRRKKILPWMLGFMLGAAAVALLFFFLF